VGFTGDQVSTFNGILTSGTSVRFSTNFALSEAITEHCSVVMRWRDRWGQLWEYKGGSATPIADSQQWQA
jgi:hypothetical protein